MGFFLGDRYLRVTLYRLSACMAGVANLFFRDLDLATSRAPHPLILPDVAIAPRQKNPTLTLPLLRGGDRKRT
ncbi:MAG: hypothetical protein ACRC8Y_17790 [Chroococcales cyanobacterium]